MYSKITYIKYSFVVILLLSSVYSLALVEAHFATFVGSLVVFIELTVLVLFLYFYIKQVGLSFSKEIFKFGYLLFYLFLVTFLFSSFHSSDISISVIFKVIGYFTTAILFFLIYPRLFFYYKSEVFALKVFLILSTFFALSTIVVSLFSLEGITYLETSIKINNNYKILGMYASGGLYVHPITLGGLVVSAFGMGFIIKKMQYGKNNLPLKKFTFSKLNFYLFLLFIAIILVKSRSATLSFAVFIMVYYLVPLSFFSNIKKFILASIYLILITILVSIIFIWLVSNIPFLYDFFRVKEGGENRFFVWSLLFPILSDGNSWLFGEGLNTAHLRIEQYGGEMLEKLLFPVGATFHNTFVTYLVEHGIISLIPYIVTLLFPILVVNKANLLSLSEKKIYVGLMLSVIVFMIFTDNNMGGIRLSSIIIAYIPGMMLVHAYTNNKV